MKINGCYSVWSEVFRTTGFFPRFDLHEFKTWTDEWLLKLNAQNAKLSLTTGK